MIKIIVCMVLSVGLFGGSEYASEYQSVYAQIKDIYHPTYQDFVLIQNYLNHGERPYLKWVNTFYGRGDDIRYDERVRKFQIIDKKSKYWSLELKKEYFNKNSKYRDRCVVSFASLNRKYESKIERLKKGCKQVGYQGHFLYRVGGWPDLEGGSLCLAHVPYAFKVCIMREAQRLGYKNVLWLDSAMIPLKKFDRLFEIMEREGYVTWSHYALSANGTEIAREAAGLTWEEYETVLQAIGGVIGVNFDHPKGRAFFDAWYQATKELDPCLSTRPEQVCMGAILYKLGFPFTGKWDDVYGCDENAIRPCQYFFVH